MNHALLNYDLIHINSQTELIVFNSFHVYFYDLKEWIKKYEVKHVEKNIEGEYFVNYLKM
ncbi:MAG: hypothetical protein ACTSRI_06435 [Promethearchaeota archaeon]